MKNVVRLHDFKLEIYAVLCAHNTLNPLLEIWIHNTFTNAPLYLCIWRLNVFSNVYPLTTNCTQLFVTSNKGGKYQVYIKITPLYQALSSMMLLSYKMCVSVSMRCGIFNVLQVFQQTLTKIDICFRSWNMVMVIDWVII